jgi:hypothetical protein
MQNGLASPQYQGRWAQQIRFCFGTPVEPAVLRLKFGDVILQLKLTDVRMQHHGCQFHPNWNGADEANCALRAAAGS